MILAVVMIIFGMLCIALGVIDAVFNITRGHNYWVLIVSGSALIVFFSIIRMAPDRVKVPLALIGVSVSVWSYVVTEIVLRLGGGWDAALALTLTQMPVVAIAVDYAYGYLVRDRLLASLKMKYGWNRRQTNTARDLMRGLPVATSAVYASTVSATALVFLLDQGVETSEARTIAFLLAVIPGTIFYCLHPSIRELRNFVKNPKDFM